MTITLPSASLRMINTGAQRVSTGRATEARDVRPVPPDRDPGVRMPNIPTGGFEALAKGLSIFAEEQAARDARLQKSHDAIQTGRMKEEYDRQSIAWDQELEQNNADFTSLKTRDDQNIRHEALITHYRTEAENKGVSPAAIEKLVTDLRNKRNGYMKALGTKMADATNKEEDRLMDGIDNRWSAYAQDNPDQLGEYLFGLKSDYVEFAHRGEARIDAGNQAVVTGAINGLVRQGRYDDARKTLDNWGKRFDEDDRIAIGNFIDSREKTDRKEANAQEDRARRLAKEAADEAEEAAVDGLVDRILDQTPSTMPSRDEILKAPIKSKNKRILDSLLTAEESRLKKKRDDNVLNQLFIGVTSGGIQPHQLADRALSSVASGQITVEQYKTLKTWAEEMQPHMNKAVTKQFLTAAHDVISEKTATVRDDMGEYQFFLFTVAYQQKIRDNLKKGITIEQMHDPNHKEYLGPMIRQYIRTREQKRQDRIRLRQLRRGTP